MKSFRVLVDTNVIMDYIADREPYAAQAYDVVALCINKTISGCIAAHTILNLFYILRKELTVEDRKKAFMTLCRIFTVVGIDRAKVVSALMSEDFSDFEDCLQNECAKSFNADYVITRNKKDFVGGSIPAVKPSEFLKLMK
jgi:predicted nucleic acid-binding protein